MLALTASGIGSSKEEAMRLCVALVTPSPEIQGLDTLFAAGDHEIFVIDSIDGAYSEIRHLQPDVVVLAVDFEECAGCRLLSMLKFDSATSHIPVVTSIGPSGPSLIDRSVQPRRLVTSSSLACSVN